MRPPRRRRPIGRAESLRRLRLAQAVPALREELVELAGESTGDLGPIH